MINYIWFFILLGGIILGIFTGGGEAISKAVVDSTQNTTTFVIKLTGLLCLWCGVLKIAEKSGLTSKLTSLLRPVLKLLFKEASRDEKALEAITMNLTANMMGLSNAATPAGIKAMEEMDKVNIEKGRATDDMALFLVLNGACIQLLPTTVMSIRAAAGSANPAAMLIPAIVSTTVAAVVGIICCKILQRYF